MTEGLYRSRAKLSTRLAFVAGGFGVACWAPLVPIAKTRCHLGDDTMGLVLLLLGAGSIALDPQRLFWRGADRVAKLSKKILLVATLFAAAMAGAQQASYPTQLEFHSSSSSLDAMFRWARGQALAYVAPSSSSIGP